MKDVWFGNYCASQLLCATICHGTVVQVKQSLVGNAHIGIGNEQSVTMVWHVFVVWIVLAHIGMTLHR